MKLRRWLMIAASGGVLPVMAGQISELDRLALAFAERPQLEKLVENNRPLLEQAYPLVVEDFYLNAGQHESLSRPEPRMDQSVSSHRGN